MGKEQSKGEELGHVFDFRPARFSVVEGWEGVHVFLLLFFPPGA